MRSSKGITETLMDPGETMEKVLLTAIEIIKAEDQMETMIVKEAGICLICFSLLLSVMLHHLYIKIYFLVICVDN